MLGTFGDMYAPGGQGIMVDNEMPVMYYHYGKLGCDSGVFG